MQYKRFSTEMYFCFPDLQQKQGVKQTRYCKISFLINSLYQLLIT